MMRTGEGKERWIQASEELKERTDQQAEQGFRVVIAGKGGVGKTTITAILSHLFTRRGFFTLAVDADSQVNLPCATGVPLIGTPSAASISTCFHIREVSRENGIDNPDSGWENMRNLTPDLSDLVRRFGITSVGGVNILSLGTVIKAETGCLCPEHALLDTVVKYISLKFGEVMLMDTPAGVEHFGRGIAKGFTQAILVTDPSFNAIQVVKQSAWLARDLRIPYLHLVVNRVRSPAEIRRVNDLLHELEGFFSGKFYLPYEEMMYLYDPDLSPLIDERSEFIDGMKEIQMIVERYGIMNR